MRSSAVPEPVPARPQPVPAGPLPKTSSVKGASTHTGGLNRSFAEVPAVRITDDDPARAEAIQALVEWLAAKFNVRLENLEIRLNDEAASVVMRHGAHGLLDGNVVYLDPSSFDPSSRAGKRILAHEMAHAAQQLLPASIVEAEPGQQQAAAEIEADAIAEMFASTYTVVAPRIPLLDAPAALVKAQQPAFIPLIETVKTSHAGEIEAIIRLLSYRAFDWAVTDTDVEDAITILATLPMLVAAAVAREIGPKYRRRFIDNLSPQHYSHRAQILAVAWAAESPAEWEGFESKILNPLDLYDLDPVESAAVAFIVGFSQKVRELAEAEPKRAARIREIEDYAASPDGVEKVNKSLEEATKEEEKAAAAQDPKNVDPQFSSLAKRIQEKLDEVVVTDDEALELLEAIAAQCLTTSRPGNTIRMLANAITDKYLDELIDQVPVEGLYVSEKRRKTFVYLLNMRPAYKNARAADKLVTGFLVSSQDAYLAYLLVRAMPEKARAAFFRSHEGARWSKVLGELPLNVRESETFNFYTGGEDDKDRQDLLTQLLDDSLWTSESKERLRGVIRMARAAGEGEFVFEQSRLRRADRIPGLGDIVDEFGLYVKDRREKYEEKPLEGHSWYQEGIFSYLGMLGASIDFIFSSDNVDVDTLALGGEGLNLYQFQDITGDAFMGARFSPTRLRDHKAVKKQRKPGETTDAKNFADVRWDVNAGQLDLRATHLELAKLAYPSEDMRIEGGPATLKAVTLGIRYMPEAHLLRSLHLGVGELDLSAVLVTMPKSIMNINRVRVTGLDVLIEASDKRHLDKTAPGAEGAGMVFSNLWNVIVGSASPDLAKSMTKPGWASEVTIRFDTLTLEGLSTSGGTFIQRVDVSKLSMHAGGDADAYRRALAESETGVKERIQEEEAHLKAPWNPETSPQHAKTLDRLKVNLQKIEEELKADKPVGSTLDVGGIKITGFAGVSGKEPIELTDVHGHGRSVTNILPLVSDSTVLRNIILGQDKVPSVKAKQPADETFTIYADIRVPSLRLVSGIPKPEEAQREYDSFVRKAATLKTRPGYQAVVDALKDRAAKAKRYGELAGRGITSLKPDELAEFKLLRNWLTAFEERRALTVDKITMDGTAITIGPDGQPGLHADSLLVQNIRTYTPDGQPALTIGEVSGADVDVSVAIREGVLGFKEYRKNLQSAEITAQRLTLKDVRNEGTGAVIDELSFDPPQPVPGADAAEPERGLTATLDRTAAGGSATVRSGRVTARGVTIPAYSALLRAELERLQGIAPGKQTEAEKKRITTINTMLGELETIHTRKKAAEDALAKKPTGKVREAAEKELARAKKDFADWESQLKIRQLTVDHLNISITGLGDVLAEGYDFDRDAAEMAVTGLGQDGKWFEQAEIQGVRTNVGGKEEAVLENTVIGPTSGGLQRTKTGWKFNHFSIGSLRASGINYQSGATKVTSTGYAALATIEFDGEVKTENKATQLILTRLSIGSVSAKGLTYEDDSAKVTIVDGEFRGILVEDLTVTMPEDAGEKTTTEGRVSVDKVRSLVLNAAAGGYSIGASLQSEQPPPGTAPARAITVKLGKSGLEEIALAQLTGTADVSKPGTKDKIHIEWKQFSAAVTHAKTEDGKGDIYRIKHLAVGSLTLAKGSHWEADNAVIDINGSAKLTNLFLDARVETRKNEKDETEVVDATINGLTIDEITADDVDILLRGGEPEPAKEKKDKKAAAAKKAEPGKQKLFQLHHGSITGLKMTGFDLINKTGRIEVLKDVDIQKLKVTIGQEGKDRVQKGTVSFKTHGKESADPTRRDREISAVFRKDGKTIQIGTIESISGTDIEGDLTSKRIDIGQVTTGPIEVTDTTVTVPDIEIASIDAEAPKYADGKGTVIQVSGGAKITGIHLPFVQAEFGPVPDGKGGTTDGMKRLRLGAKPGEAAQFIVDKIEGTDFRYRGLGDRDKETGLKPATIVRAKKVIITTLKAANIERDFVEKITKFEGGIENAKLDGFAFVLKKSLSDKAFSKRLLGDVNATGLRADLSLSDTSANGKPWVSDQSSFELDELGLTHVSYHDLDKSFKLDGKDADGADATLKGLKTKFTPDGTAFMKFDELAAHNMRLFIHGTTVELKTAELKEFAFGLKGALLEEGKRELALKLKSFRFEGLRVDMTSRREPLTAEAFAKAAANKDQWVLEPLGNMSGDLRVTYHHKVDVHAGIPIRDGVIDFDDVSRPGFVVPMGADHVGLYADVPVEGRVHFYEPPGGAGITPETWKEGPDNSQHVDKRGKVNLRKMIEAAMNEAPSAEPPTSLEALNAVGIETSNLRLGTGKLGKGNNWIELTGKESPANVFSVTSTRIGEYLELSTPVFHATRGHFEAMGKQGDTGAIEVQALTVGVSRLGSSNTGSDASPVFTFDVTIRAAGGKIEDIQWGDVHILKTDKTGLVGEPEPKKKGAAATK